MIRSSAFLVLFCMWTTAALAAPVISADKPVYNFGTIAEGTRVDHVFTIRNNGDSPLNIISVRPSCGCTAANASSPVIQPGKSGEIKTSFNSANFSGRISKTISVSTNDPKNPILMLTMNGRIASEIQVTPRQLNYGQVKIGTTKTLSISVENKGANPIKLLSIKSPMPQVTIKTEKTFLKPGEATTIRISVTPRAEDRFLSGYMSINTDSRSKPEINVPIYGSLTR